MDLLGIIHKADHEAEIDYDTWLAAASADSRLSRMPPVEGINPLTRKPMLYERPYAMDVTVDGRTIGTMVWEAGVIHISGSENALADVAAELASILGATFHTMGELER